MFGLSTSYLLAKACGVVPDPVSILPQFPGPLLGWSWCLSVGSVCVDHLGLAWTPFTVFFSWFPPSVNSLPQWWWLLSLSSTWPPVKLHSALPPFRDVGDGALCWSTIATHSIPGQFPFGPFGSPLGVQVHYLQLDRFLMYVTSTFSPSLSGHGQQLQAFSVSHPQIPTFFPKATCQLCSPNAVMFLLQLCSAPATLPLPSLSAYTLLPKSTMCLFNEINFFIERLSHGQAPWFDRLIPHLPASYTDSSSCCSYSYSTSNPPPCLWVGKAAKDGSSPWLPGLTWKT